MKEKDLDKDTIVAYHAYLQNRIHNDLNSIGLGPSWFPFRMAIILAFFSLASLIVGILVITLRHRHVYLVDWWHAFVGPFFIILALMCASLAVYMVITAKRRSNEYRRELFFRPIGDYGVAVVHKSTLMHDQEHKSDLKTGTAPHRTVLPSERAHSAYAHDRRRHRERHGHENRGYSHNGQEDRDHHHRRDDRGRHGDDRRRRDDRDRDRPRPDDREREHRRHRDEREPRRHPDERREEKRRPRDDRERSEHDPEKRRPPPEDREPRDPEKVRPDDRERGPTQGGRRAVRGIPRISVGEVQQQGKVVLDEDFGKPATDESEL